MGYQISNHESGKGFVECQLSPHDIFIPMTEEEFQLINYFLVSQRNRHKKYSFRVCYVIKAWYLTQ